MTSRYALLSATILAFSGLYSPVAVAASGTKHHVRTSHRPSSQVQNEAPKATAGSAEVASPRRGGRAPRAVSASGSEDMIVTGTHSVNRRARESISPITVLSAATLQRSGLPNLAEAITRTYASINIETMGTDVAELVSAVHMRGLSSNQVLVLVDGKRRHTTANFTAVSGPNFGTTGADLNMIPANMIDHVEVLEDGAAAMYGSDAIAGVVNIITKKQNHGVNMSAQTGANAYNGDGWQYQLNADGGMKLGKDGYVHLFGQLFHTDHFVAKNAADHRLLKNQPPDSTTSFYSEPGINLPPELNKYISTPEETRENFGLTWGKPLTENIQAYGNITYTHRHAEAYQYYRIPGVGGGVARGMYPSGTTPLETMEENDYAATLGAKGGHLLGFDWDLSTTYGSDYDKVGAKNTVNTGMLSKNCSGDPGSPFYSSSGCGWSPSTVRAESFSMSQWTNRAEFRRGFDIANLVPVTVTFGGEHRLDMYQIWAGEPPSYQLGGTQAFSGLAPQNAGKWNRNIWSAYADGDFHPTRKWELDFAGRFEHYTDVGNTQTGKVSTRYDFTKRIAVRGTISTGFRAPTLAEEHFSAVNVSPNGASGLLGASSGAAATLGAAGLKPERSTSASAGIVVEPLRGLHVEVSAYQINIRDRIVQGGTVNGNIAIDAIRQMGFSLPGNDYDPDNVTAYYLSNGASTRTQGLDVNADYMFRFHQYGTLQTTVALDLNRTRLHHNGTWADPTTGLQTEYLNAQNIGYITTAYPRSKLILNAYYTVGKWDVNLRQTRYGQTTNMLSYNDWGPRDLQYSVTDFAQFHNTPRWLTDIQVGYRLNDNLHLSVGANNVFNIRPRQVPESVNYLGGTRYDQSASQVPMTGGYYFGRIDGHF